MSHKKDARVIWVKLFCGSLSYACFESLVCAISLFRSFVFSPGVMARRQDEITPSEKTK